MEQEVITQVNGISFRKAYFVRGSLPKGHPYAGRYNIKDPPTSGYSRVIVIQPDQASDSRRRKRQPRLTLLCPYTLESFQVSPRAREIEGLPEYIMDDALVDQIEELIHRNWKAAASYGQQRAFDIAAMVLTKLGRSVPNYKSVAADPVEHDRHNVPSRKGKPVADKLTRPISRTSKRGIVAAFFLESENGSILEAMAKFDMSRSGVLTHLNGMHKEHGLGYVLNGDVASLMLPEGCTDPLADETDAKSAASSQTARKAGKPLVEGDHTLPAKGKRRAVALAMLEERELEEVATEIGCSVGSVRSHLHDLHSKHGFGHELSADKKRGKLLVPADWSADESYEDLDPLA